MDIIRAAFILKRLLSLVRNVEPMNRNLVKGFIWEFKENSIISLCADDIDSLNKVLREISFKIVIVDNHLLIVDIKPKTSC